MKIKVSEATGIVLDWLVTSIENPEVIEYGVDYWLSHYRHTTKYGEYVYRWHQSWAQGGPIVEREWLDITPWPNETREDMRWHCQQHDTANDCAQYGPTPLIAAMRCYVASKLGDEVEVPDSLITPA